MMKKLGVLVIVAALFTACQKQEKETPSGMKFTVLKQGDGVVPKKREIVVFDYVLKDASDSVWNSTYEDGLPVATQVGDSTRLPMEDGMTQMFRMLSKGDSVTTSMSVNELFRKMVRASVPRHLDSAMKVTYTLRIHNILPEQEYVAQRQAQVTERDTRLINEYITKNNLKAQTDSSGLQVVLHNSDGGRKPTVDDCVEVKYRGRLMRDNREFDKAERVSFALKRVIDGWKIGIPYLGVGDSATLLIPSALAYGRGGVPGAIPPDAILVFDVTLIDVKGTYDEATRACK